MAVQMQVEPGVYYDVAFSEYQSWAGYNPSLIIELLNDCALAMRYTVQFGGESTDEMDLGTAVHLAILQPRLFDAICCVYEGARRAGKAWEAFEEENAGKQILTASQFQKCIACRDAVRNHPAAYELISGDGRAEVSVVWIDPTTGALCKTRCDFVGGRRSVDLKTAADPKPHAFTRAVVKYGYHISMAARMSALWENGIEVESSHFVVVGNKPWHDVIRYDCSASLLGRGRDLWEQGLARALECEKSGEWPGFAPEPYLLELPEWAMGKQQEITVGGETAFSEDE